MQNSSGTWTYTYDDEGMRTQRTNGTETYNYIYSGGKLRAMTVDGHSFIFRYGADGRPYSVQYDGVDYFYVLNAQGDVLGIVDGNGANAAVYTYNAWGNVLSSSSNTLAQLNPLRYRGYVYDQETGLYYLQSRYYNPEWGRFLNADEQLATDTPLGLNMFAYCFNNPVACADPTGQFPLLLVTVLAICTFVGGVLGATSDEKLGPDANEAQAEDENQELTFGDRVMNTIIGMSFGLATGGAIMSLAGVIGTCVVGSGATTIGLFGATGLQTMAQGALAFDFVAIVIGPLIGAEMEPIEYE